MSEQLQQTEWKGFDIISNMSSCSVYPDETLVFSGTKIILIQMPPHSETYYEIPMENRYYDYFNAESPINGVFENYLSRHVYDYFINLPFVQFFNLKTCITHQDGYVAWKFPHNIQTFFGFKIVVDPYMRDYFMIMANPENDEFVYATDAQLMTIQNSFFYPGPELLEYKWICCKSFPLPRGLFPIFVAHAGSLFGDNYLSNQNNNYFNSRVIGTVTQGFNINFNPTIFIPYTDALFNTQRFYVLNSKERTISFDPNSSHVWFELFFY